MLSPMRRLVSLLALIVLVGCGGGGGGGSSAPTPTITSPSIDLVGAYTLTGYYRDGVEQGTSGGELEIGHTQIYTRLSALPPPWENGTYTYTMGSSLQGEYIVAKSGPTTIYSVYIGTDSSLILTTWTQISNVVYEYTWRKTSDITALN